MRFMFHSIASMYSLSLSTEILSDFLAMVTLIQNDVKTQKKTSALKD